jgi:dephospho-CoA kinase
MSSLIAITGGIGAGKSVVSALLRRMGYRVYDCDSRAKALMAGDGEIQRRLTLEFGPEIVTDGVVDRRRLASIVFADRQRLLKLNAIVHKAVGDDLRRWATDEPEPPLFVETAILYQSGLDRVVDGVWEVTAPDRLRVARVVARSGLTPDEVRARIDSQRSTAPRETTLPALTIVNDGVVPLLPQVERLLAQNVI